MWLPNLKALRMHRMDALYFFSCVFQDHYSAEQAQLHLARCTLLGALDRTGLLLTAVHACCLADAPLCKEHKAVGGVFSLVKRMKAGKN